MWDFWRKPGVWFAGNGEKEWGGGTRREMPLNSCFLSTTSTSLVLIRPLTVLFKNGVGVAQYNRKGPKIVYSICFRFHLHVKMQVAKLDYLAKFVISYVPTVRYFPTVMKLVLPLNNLGDNRMLQEITFLGDHQS